MAQQDSPYADPGKVQAASTAEVKGQQELARRLAREGSAGQSFV